jgi:cytochrome c2
MISWILILCFALLAPAQDPAAFFKKNCAACHSIGRGKLAGPDLKDVSGRRDREWLVRFLLDPKGVVQSGDAYAAGMVKEFRGMVMPVSKAMNPALAGELLDWIAAQSKAVKPAGPPPLLPGRPFTPDEIERGRRLFDGELALAKGGPACFSCHTAAGVGGLGGGRLGPDLTGVCERMGGRNNLAAWLGALSTPVMQPAYQRHPLQPADVTPLVAYLETRTGSAAPRMAAMLTFLLAGVAGALAALFVFDTAWKSRFRAVRKPMVLASTRRREE